MRGFLAVLKVKLMSQICQEYTPPLKKTLFLGLFHLKNIRKVRIFGFFNS